MKPTRLEKDGMRWGKLKLSRPQENIFIGVASSKSRLGLHRTVIHLANGSRTIDEPWLLPYSGI